MSFFGTRFTIDGQISSKYKLFIGNIGEMSVTDVSAGSNVSLITDTVYRNPKPYFYGITQNEVLTFEMTVLSKDALTGNERNQIGMLLFGNTNYKKLKIVECDISTVHFNCIFTNPQAKYVGNFCYGYTFTVICDAPWAWGNNKIYNYQIANNMASINIRNDSADPYYTFPVLTLKMKDAGGTVTITNKTDNNRETIITGLQGFEEITIDNARQIITSSTGLNRSGNFNKVFLRLLPKVNELSLTGYIDTLKIEYPVAVKIGG